MIYDQNGAADEPESEREDRQAWEAGQMPDSWRGDEHPDEDPYEGWPEPDEKSEYWLYLRDSESGEV